MEPPEFQGLLYCDGLDSLGRPVVVINADAVAEDKGARKAAFEYLLHQLEPVVTQVAALGPFTQTRFTRLLFYEEHISARASSRSTGADDPVWLTCFALPFHSLPCCTL